MVFHIKQSIKRLNEKKEAEKKAQDEISELQDAIIEIADIVAATVSESEEDITNG